MQLLDYITGNVVSRECCDAPRLHRGWCCENPCLLAHGTIVERVVAFEVGEAIYGWRWLACLRPGVKPSVYVIL